MAEMYKLFICPSCGWIGNYWNAIAYVREGGAVDTDGDLNLTESVIEKVEYSCPNCGDCRSWDDVVIVVEIDDNKVKIKTTEAHSNVLNESCVAESVQKYLELSDKYEFYVNNELIGRLK